MSEISILNLIGREKELFTKDLIKYEKEIQDIVASLTHEPYLDVGKPIDLKLANDQAKL